MKKSQWFLVFVIIAIATVVIVYMFKREPDRMKTIYCGPNNTDPVLVSMNPAAEFPVVVNSYSVQLNAGMNLLDEAAGDFNTGSEVRSDIVELREKLGQEAAQFQDILRAAYFGFNNRPCDPNAKKAYDDMLQSLQERVKQIEELESAVVVDKEEPKAGDSTTTPPVITKDTTRVKSAILQYRRKFVATRPINSKIKAP